MMRLEMANSSELQRRREQPRLLRTSPCLVSRYRQTYPRHSFPNTEPGHNQHCRLHCILRVPSSPPSILVAKELFANHNASPWGIVRRIVFLRLDAMTREMQWLARNHVGCVCCLVRHAHQVNTKTFPTVFEVYPGVSPNYF